MHDARQQAILTALGIRQWVPRATATMPVPPAAVQLWRQQTDEPEQVVVETLTNTVTQAKQNSASSLESTHEITGLESGSTHATVVLTTQPDLSESAWNQPEVVAQPERMDKTNWQQTARAEVETALEDNDGFELETASIPLYSFRLQACEINQWIVLVNEADLQDPQLNKLWKNILLAFRQPEMNHFSWPLSEGQRWQRMTGSKAALNGFLFKMGLDKRVGLMSELADEVCSDRIERLPHLAELIEQPLKKRLLWELLKKQ